MKSKLTVKELTLSHLEAIMKLQQKIIDGFQPDEQHFILHRTAEDYKKALNGTSSHMLGVFDGEELIAQTIYGTPQNNESRDMPEFLSNKPNDSLVIYEAILVSPEYRGSGLMKKMLDFIEREKIDKIRTCAIIQIAADNPASWINALHYGMKITKVDRDPEDNAQVIYLEKALHQPVAHAEYLPLNVYEMYLGDNIHKIMPCLFKKMQFLASKGYTGVRLDKKKKCLIWHNGKQITHTLLLKKQQAKRKDNSRSI